MTTDTRDAVYPPPRGRSVLVVLVCLVIVASAAAAVWLELARTERAATTVSALGALDGSQRAALEALARGERDSRRIEAVLLSANVALALAALIGLARPRRLTAPGGGESSGSLRPSVVGDSVASSAAAGAPDAPLPAARIPERAPRSSGPGSDGASPQLRALVGLCASAARADSFVHLSAVLADAAAVVPATGIVVWAAPIGASDLRPALAHGYPAALVARLKPMPRTADNATANACRTGHVQIVRAKQGDATGAIVSPLMSAQGCVGCLAAEVPAGMESAADAQAAIELLAAAIAARFGQTAALDSAISVAPEVRSA